MTVGRNEPCPCGSGKKYKRCCISTSETVKDEIEQIVSLNPNITIDELNAALKSKMDARNNRPLDAFCGLSPAQMSQWLYAPFGETAGLSMTKPANLAKSPVMRYLDVIIEAIISSKGSLKGTAKGNLPAKIAKDASALLPQFAVAQFNENISISEFAGNSEDHFTALHYTRLLAEVAKIIQLKKGHFVLGSRAKLTYEKEGISGLYFVMLEAAFTHYNWAYLDGWQDDISLQKFWRFMLWRLSCHSDISRLTQEMSIAFPDLIHQIEPSPYCNQQDTLGRMIETRFVSRFLEYFGMVVVNPLRMTPEGKPITPKTTLQPLLKQTFSFTV